MSGRTDPLTAAPDPSMFRPFPAEPPTAPPVDADPPDAAAKPRPARESRLEIASQRSSTTRKRALPERR